MSNSRIAAFRAAAEQKGIPGTEVDAWLECARLYLCLPVVPEGPPPVDGPVAGRKGGLPLLPPDLDWPVGPSGPLPFHGLVDCAALPRDEDLDLPLPADGHLLFFINFDDTMINYEGPDTAFDHEQEAARLIYVPGGVPVQERPVPVADGKPVFTAFPAVELRAVVDVDTPNWLGNEYAAEFVEFAARVPHWNQLRDLSEQVWRGWFGDRDIRLGGYPLSAQTDPADAIAEHEQRTAGGDLSSLRRRAEQEWVPLAQLGSEEPVESATVARFMARRTDVEAGDYTRVLSVAEFME